MIAYKIIYAPGCFEIPFLISKNIKKYDGFIALGCVIRGETYHFEVLAHETARSLSQVSISNKKPVIFLLKFITLLNLAYYSTHF